MQEPWVARSVDPGFEVVMAKASRPLPRWVGKVLVKDTATVSDLAVQKIPTTVLSESKL